MSDIFNDPRMAMRTEPIPRPTGRLILVADEIGGGAFALDMSTTLHPSKIAMIALHLLKNCTAAVDDELQRKEILDGFDEVAGIVTGRIPSQAEKVFKRQDIKICEHGYGLDVNGIVSCVKCGRAK